MAKFKTAFNFHKVLPLPEGFDDPTPNLQLVRPLSVEQQVEQFLQAGERLEQYRNLGFDFGPDDDIDEDLDDPTREPDFDLIDAAVAERDFMLAHQRGRNSKTEDDLNFKNESESEKSDPVADESAKNPSNNSQQSQQTN